MCKRKRDLGRIYELLNRDWRIDVKEKEDIFNIICLSGLYTHIL